MKVAITLLVTLLSPLALAQAPATAPSGTRYAARSVRVTWQDFTSSRDQREALDTVLNKLTPGVLGLPTEQLRDYYSDNQDDQGDHTKWSFQITLPQGVGRPVAKEFMDELLRGFVESMRASYRLRQAKGMEPLELNLKAESQRLAEATNHATVLRNKLRDVAGRADVSSGGVKAAVAKLEEERQKLELDVMGKTARRAALEVEIADQSNLASKKLADDPISAELQKVVAARQEALDQAQKLQAKGAVSANDITNAVTALADARAKLLERKRDAAAEAGGATLESFNRELLTLSVDLRELSARLEFVKSRLSSLREAMDLLEPLAEAEGELEAARRDQTNARNNVRLVQHSIDLSKEPTIEVLWSDDRAEPPK